MNAALVAAIEFRLRVGLMEQTTYVTSSLPIVRQYLGKLKRHSRHVPKLINYGTPRKVGNIMLAEWELRRQKTILRCLPYYYIVDVCNVCNLRCPLCPTGNTTIARKQAMLSFERDYVKELLRRAEGNASQAAKQAGVSRQLFYRLIARHGLR